LALTTGLQGKPLHSAASLFTTTMGCFASPVTVVLTSTQGDNWHFYFTAGKTLPQKGQQPAQVGQLMTTKSNSTQILMPQTTGSPNFSHRPLGLTLKNTK
jgi:hypothetical protein